MGNYNAHTHLTKLFPEVMLHTHLLTSDKKAVAEQSTDCYYLKIYAGDLMSVPHVAAAGHPRPWWVPGQVA